MAFGFYRTVTIDHTKVGSTDSTNFPVLISGTYTYLKTIGNGGKVENASGYDVGFYSDSALTTTLKWETKRYVAATGEVIYWVKVPTVSHTTDTVIYLAYGDATISTDQSDAANTWDSGFQIVNHLEDGSTLSYADSSSNARTGTAVGSPTAATGKVGGGGLFASGQYYKTALDGTAYTNLTIAFWVKPTSNGATFGYFQFAIPNDPVYTAPFCLIQNNSGTLRYFCEGTYQESSQTISNGTWYRVAMTLNHSGVGWAFYLNGIQLSTFSSALAFRGAAQWVYFATGYNAQADAAFDEPSVSNVTRSGDWLLADYNNQNSPSTFYALGTEQITSTAYTMTADVGLFTLTGQNATLTAACRMTAEAGLFTLTGYALSSGVVNTLTAGAGLFVLTGQSAGLRAALRLTAETGLFTLTGFAIGEVITVPPKHYTVRNYAQPLYRIVDTTNPTYTASVSISPQYTITEIKQDE